MLLTVQFAVNDGRDPVAIAFRIEQWLKEKGIGMVFSRVDGCYDMTATLNIDAFSSRKLRDELEVLLPNIDGIAGHSLALTANLQVPPAVAIATGPRERLSVLAEQ